MTDFNPNLLPPAPQFIPDEMARLSVDNTKEWSTRVPPQAVGMFIAAVTQWLSNPRFGTKVTVDTRIDGWTIQVDLPKPELREDVTFDE